MSDSRARASRPNWQEAQSSTARADERRHLEIVSSRNRRRARPRIVYALTAIAGLAAIVVAQLLLSVGISQGAYEISTLEDSQVELGRTAERLSEDLVRVSSPQGLAANAEALGMVSNANPVYLRLSDGAVLGAPSSAPGSQGGAAGLVPNALLAGVPLVTQLPSIGAHGTGVAVNVGIGSESIPPAAPTPDPVSVQNGLPSPTTR